MAFHNGGRCCLSLNYFRCLFLSFWSSNPGQPTKSTSWPEHCVKISFQSHYYFQRCDHLKIVQIWFKTPIPPKFNFWGVLTHKHYFSSSRPPKGTSLAKTASYEPLSVAIGPAVWQRVGLKNTKRGEPMRWQTGYYVRLFVTIPAHCTGIGPDHAVNPILTIFGMRGGPWTCF